MKKILIVLGAAAVLCSTNPVMAASDPFSDVPTNHWAYEAVKNLAQAGIVSGSDGAFRGERTMTRYEMALVVANAMTKMDKADTKTKVVVDKLIQEFADELKGLGKRLETVEKKQGPLTISGFAQYRYEYVKHPRALAEDAGYLTAPSPMGRATDKSNTRTLFGLVLNNQFDGDTYFHGMLMMETLGGRTTDADLEVKEAFFGKKIGANAELAAGRFITCVGLGTLGGAAYMDGGRLSFGKDVKVNLMSTKFGSDGLVVTYSDGTTPATPTNMPNYTFNHGDVKFNLHKDLRLSLAYLADKDKTMYDSKAVGLEYKGVRDIIVSAEYAKNSADTAKLANGTAVSPAPGVTVPVAGDSPQAYFIKAKYKSANPFVPGTYGFWVQYKKADAGFDMMGMANADTWNSPFNHTTPAGSGIAENIQGFEYGFETTVAKRLMLKIAYDDLERVSDTSVISLANDSVKGNKDQSYLTAQLTYIF